MNGKSGPRIRRLLSLYLWRQYSPSRLAIVASKRPVQTWQEHRRVCRIQCRVTQQPAHPELQRDCQRKIAAESRD